MYIFSYTSSNAQAYLEPRYSKELEDLFLIDYKIIDYLASIYKDPYKVQNARHKYKGLMMKPIETFANFYTHFLHLARQAKILRDDLQLDLFNKLTLELQKIVLLVYSTLTIARTLANQCLLLNQGLYRIKAHLDQVKAYNTLSRSSTLSISPPIRTTPTNSRLAARESTPARTPFSQGATLDRFAQPQYLDLALQALSD